MDFRRRFWILGAVFVDFGRRSADEAGKEGAKTNAAFNPGMSSRGSYRCAH